MSLYQRIIDSPKLYLKAANSWKEDNGSIARYVLEHRPSIWGRSNGIPDSVLNSRQWGLQLAALAVRQNPNNVTSVERPDMYGKLIDLMLLEPHQPSSWFFLFNRCDYFTMEYTHRHGLQSAYRTRILMEYLYVFPRLRFVTEHYTRRTAHAFLNNHIPDHLTYKGCCVFQAHTRICYFSCIKYAALALLKCYQDMVPTGGCYSLLAHDTSAAFIRDYTDYISLLTNNLAWMQSFEGDKQYMLSSMQSIQSSTDVLLAACSNIHSMSEFSRPIHSFVFLSLSLNEPPPRFVSDLEKVVTQCQGLIRAEDDFYVPELKTNGRKVYVMCFAPDDPEWTVDDEHLGDEYLEFTNSLFFMFNTPSRRMGTAHIPYL
jgi:hypothetical protein